MATILRHCSGPEVLMDRFLSTRHVLNETLTALL